MKLVIILLTTAIIQVSAASYAQKVTMKQHGIELVNVFQEIRKQTGYDFLYSDKIMEQAKTVDLNLQDVGIEEALEICFKDQPLSYSIENKIVTVRLKKPGFLSRIAAAFGSIDASGRVVDSENRPLPGASVKVKKTGKGVSTDKDGRFFLRGVEEGAVLVISFIGYVSKEVKAAKELGDVVLEVSLSKLDEVQVIAYGTTTQRLSTGNVTTIKADVIEKQPVNNPLLALQGRVPGLFIEQGSGFSGTAVKVRIQGTNSILSGNDPLYVIDGVPFVSQLLPGGNGILTGAGSGTSELGGSPLNFINPGDIESIDILKDADATAIYGSRAANGAILITTKKGKGGDLKVSANLQAGWGKVVQKLKVMNGEQYLQMRKQAYKNDNIDLNEPPYNTNLYKIYDHADLSLWDTGRYTDWQKELIGHMAQYQDLQASVSGGNKLTTFLVGAGHHKEGNVFPGDFSDAKSSVHFNINSASGNNKFKVQFSGSYLINNCTLPSVDLTSSALTLAPIAPSLFNTDGSVNWEPGESVSGRTTFILNPIVYSFQKFKNTMSNLIGNGILGYEILPGLDLKTSFGYNDLKSNIISYVTSESVAPENTQYFIRTTNFGNSRNNTWSIEPQLNYHVNIGKGRLEFLAGSTILKQTGDASSIAASGFNTDLVMEDIASATALTALSSLNSVYKYNAIFSRVNYNWEDRYILNVTARRDGSSRFGSANKFHNFGAIGAAWIFSEEYFIKNKISFLSYGKLRGSYGTTGNDQIADYSFLSLYYPTSIQIPYQGIDGYLPINLANPYLQWEETRKFQIGLDLGFLKDRILFNVNYSHNRSSNQLLPYALPNATGFSSIQTNFPATLQNVGWEFTLSTINFDKSGFKWTSGFNITIPRNKLVDFPNLENSSYGSLYSIGQSINIQKLFHYLGVNPSTGSYEFADRNGNPTSNPVPNGNPKSDAVIIVNPDPKYYGGFSNTFIYRGFQLDFLFQFTKQIGRNNFLGSNVSNAGFYSNGLNNKPVEFLDSWEKPGDIAKREKYSSSFLSNSGNNARSSDAVWSDASYIRLKNLSLSWQMPQKWIRSMHINNSKLFIQGQNLLTITNYLGLDPETKSSTSLPPLRVVTLGFKIDL
jgi:TonB-linked SusC/RagA family outer membrane protein